MDLLVYLATALFLATNDFSRMAKTGLIDVAAVVFVLGILVFVHEFGHFAVAKLCGVRVETFSLGFGKRLWGFRRGDTDYRISVLPLGGYVKMAGENPLETRTGDPGEFTSHPRWQRFLIAVAGPVMNILLAFVILTGVYMFHHEYPAMLKNPVDVVSVNPGSAAEKAGIHPRDRIVKIDGIENPSWEQALVRIEINPKQPVAVTLLRDGGKVEKTLVPDVSGPDRMGDAGIEPPAVAGTIEPGSPAEKAGVRPGDVLLSLDGKPIQGMRELQQILEKSKTNPVQLRVLRDGEELSLTVIPQLMDTPGEAEKKYRIGIGMMQVERLPFVPAVSQAVGEMKSSSLLVFELAGKLIEGKNKIQQISSPIGIARATGQAALLGPWFLLGIMAMISLQLAIFNLFPIPILDGGLMLMLLIEGVIRRDIKQEVKERVYQVAFVFLMLFAAVVIFNDVLKSFHS